ncbi:NAD kinase-like isoform X1 [Lates japonicus]|uniref:NAD kinase-like isoform X1 n=1 Tax=Lates japonicus TaxID=270547 RepID=A0AAD3MBI4_LATJO|nr:NAD kinase-like isoform X1 [Lates japonicus]
MIRLVANTYRYEHVCLFVTQMENSETSPSSGSLAVPDRGMTRPSGPPGQLSESARLSKHREHPSKSPRRRREGKRSQRRGDGHEQLLWEIERRRLPGQHEHLEPSGSTSDTAESSPKRRAHFLHGPYPATHFGPKACILPNPTSVMHIQDPASQRLTWNKPPVNVLVIRKIRDDSLVEPFKELCREADDGVRSRRVMTMLHCQRPRAFGSIRNQLCTFRRVLNEVVVDRGPSSYLSNVDLYLDGRLITSVQGYGVIVSTPTGSTAYAAAAGASMIHPNVPAIMVTPICPHSLSFRPIVVPAGVELMITLSPDARNTAWVSFDGRKRQEIQHGDCIKITTSCYPVPSICCHDLVYDWFESLAQCLHWNVRKRQARLADVSDSSDTEN